jgi:hypothetical protein
MHPSPLAPVWLARSTVALRRYWGTRARTIKSRPRCCGGSPPRTLTCWRWAGQADESELRIIRYHRRGGPEVLQLDEAPTPQLQPGELLVEVTGRGSIPTRGAEDACSNRSVAGGSGR